MLIFINRNPNVEIDLSKYIVDLTFFSNVVFNYLPDKLSALVVVEFVFLISMVFRIFNLLLRWFTLSDRRVSIYHTKSNLLPKLTTNQKFYFSIGVIIYNLFSRLGILIRLISYYLIVSNLEILLPFIKIPAIFVFVGKFLDLFLNLCGFTQENLLETWVNKLKKIYTNFDLKDKSNKWFKFKLGDFIA